MSGDGYNRHDCAVALAYAIMEIFKNVVREDEFQDALDEVYLAAKAGLEFYDSQRAHIAKRLEPLNN